MDGAILDYLPLPYLELFTCLDRIWRLYQKSMCPTTLISKWLSCRTGVNSEICDIFFLYQPYPTMNRTRRDFEFVHVLIYYLIHKWKLHNVTSGILLCIVIYVSFPCRLSTKLWELTIKLQSSIWVKGKWLYDRICKIL
mgnify:CR=1 FL=1